MLANLRKYYKTLVAVVGAVLVLLTQLTPVFDFLPGQWHNYFTVAVSVLTAVSVFLVKNEALVEGPPAA
jgi:low affinity Fe/Cu permease